MLEYRQRLSLDRTTKWGSKVSEAVNGLQTECYAAYATLSMKGLKNLRLSNESIVTQIEVLVGDNIVAFGESSELEYDQAFGIQCPDVENGYDGAEKQHLGWLNSAKVWVSPEKEEISLTVSVGDPRGCFVLTLYRNSEGILHMRTPHPEDSLLHLPLTETMPGTYRVG